MLKLVSILLYIKKIKINFYLEEKKNLGGNECD